MEKSRPTRGEQGEHGENSPSQGVDSTPVQGKDKARGGKKNQTPSLD